MASETGEVALRTENISKVLNVLALRSYVFKSHLPMVTSSTAWKETYYQEAASDLTASGTRNIKGVSRLAKFPNVDMDWTTKSKYQIKHAAETTIAWEDTVTDDVDVISRSLLRVARAIAKSVDEEIWDVISESQSASAINSLSITAGSEWDSATIGNRDPIQNILDAKTTIAVDNYNPEGAFLLLSPKDYANLLGNANVRNAGQFYTDSVTRNGNVGTLLGLNILVSNNVTADYAMIIVAKESCSYKQVQALKTVSTQEPGIKTVIKSWEVGVTQLTNPEAICLIDNTQK